MSKTRVIPVRGGKGLMMAANKEEMMYRVILNRGPALSPVTWDDATPGRAAQRASALASLHDAKIERRPADRTWIVDATEYYRREWSNKARVEVAVDLARDDAGRNRRVEIDKNPDTYEVGDSWDDPEAGVWVAAWVWVGVDDIHDVLDGVEELPEEEGAPAVEELPEEEGAPAVLSGINDRDWASRDVFHYHSDDDAAVPFLVELAGEVFALEDVIDVVLTDLPAEWLIQRVRSIDSRRRRLASRP